MKKQESKKMGTKAETMKATEIREKKELKKKKTFADWLIQTIGASAIAGICEMNGSCDGGMVYRNLQR